MPRLSIDITSDQHQKLKAIAALKGLSIKDYVLSQTLSDTPDIAALSEEQAIEALSVFLMPRIEEAERGELSTRSFQEIRDAAKKSLGV